MTAATAGQFDEDSLAQLHVNVRVDGERVEEVEEFMQVLDGVAEWFFEIEGEGDVALLSLPARHQIYYHGAAPHGGWFHANSRSVVFSQIVGPAEWEMRYTGAPNPLLDEIRATGALPPLLPA